MYVIAALLDAHHDRVVRRLYTELETELGIRSPFVLPIPHCTHLQTSLVQEQPLTDALERFSSRQAPYSLRTAGLALFTGQKTALYIPVIRTTRLNAVHDQLLGHVTASVGSISGPYRHDLWVPHITLVLPQSGREILPAVVQRLIDRDFDWEIQVEELAVLSDQSPHKPLWRFPLRGARADDG